MFTGLIEAMGSITVVTPLPGASGSRIRVNAEAVLTGMQLGDSIAIDGACMTVTAFDNHVFEIEVSPESLAKTGFGHYQPGTKVNLERSLMPTSRIGGHYVTGHIDGQARLIDKQPEGISWVMTFEVLDAALAKYLVPKGSIAISGISLTVNTVEKACFTVAIIPHTLSHTNLGAVEMGALLNIETDLLGKYVHQLLQSGEVSYDAQRTAISV